MQSHTQISRRLHSRRKQGTRARAYFLSMTANALIRTEDLPHLLNRRVGRLKDAVERQQYLHVVHGVWVAPRSDCVVVRRLLPRAVAVARRQVAEHKYIGRKFAPFSSLFRASRNME